MARLSLKLQNYLASACEHQVNVRGSFKVGKVRRAPNLETRFENRLKLRSECSLAKIFDGFCSYDSFNSALAEPAATKRDKLVKVLQSGFSEAKY